MDPFLSHLADHCRIHITKNKWVVVPSLALGHTLGERLTLEGTEWTNLRFTTPDELARQIAAPFLIVQGVNPASDGIGPALIMRLMADLPPQTPSYFRHMAHQTKMAEALWRSISELRMAGITALTLAQSRFPSDGKRDELAALLQAYERSLHEAKQADQAAVLHEALGHMDACPIRSDHYWCEIPDVLWHPLQQRLLDAVQGTKLQLPAISIPGLAMPRRLRSDGRQNRVLPDPFTDAERLAFLLKPTASPSPKQDGTVQLFRAGSQEGEVEEVFRRIQTSDIHLDHVELACASQKAVVLVWEKAARYGWPVTIGPGLPIVLTRPARALLAFSSWISRGFPAEALRRLLQSGDIKLGLDGEPSEGQAARLLVESGATWGRHTYATSLENLGKVAIQRARDIEGDTETQAHAERQANRATRLAGWIVGLLHAIPQSESGGNNLEPWLQAMEAFIQNYAAIGNDLDAAARTAILGTLTELHVIAALPRSAKESLDLIRETIESLTVGSDRARPGHLHITTLHQVGYAGRPHTYLLNLEEGVVFPAPIEDPVLLDTERAAVSPDLPTSQDRTSEVLFAIVSRLATFQSHVTMSFACCNTREHRETFPSWLLLQAIRVLHPDQPWTYENLNKALGNPVSVVPASPDVALSDAGWWLNTVRGRGSDAEPSVLTAFPWLSQGAKAHAARCSDQFTVYDGLVTAAGPALDPRTTGRPISATQLEQLAACPFRYYLQHALHIRAPQEATPDPDAWLDPLTRGSLLHELYAAAWREFSTRGEQPDPDRHSTWLCRLAQERLARLRQDMPPPSEQVYERETQLLLADLQVFLQFEQASRGRKPLGHEIAFGTDQEGEDVLASREPVTIQLPNGTSFQLRGRLDRLDQLADGSYEVVDYKTGGLRLPGGLTAIYAGGQQLQHALYALAAAELLKRAHITGRVNGGSYYFPTMRGGGERISKPLSNSRAILSVLADLLDVMAAGAFPNTQDEQTCKYCDFQRACGDNPWGRTSLKLPNERNTMLNSFKALTGHA